MVDKAVQPHSNYSRAERSRELQIALEILAAVSSLAVDIQGEVGGPYTRFKADDSPITDADLEIERLIIDRLGTFFPEARFLGEESAKNEDIDLNGDLWVIDPIDGTTNYALGLSTYAISIGLIRDGDPALGAVALPRVHEQYFCDFGSAPALRNGRTALRVADKLERHQFPCMPSSMLKYYRIDFPGTIRSFGSTVYHILLVARGVAAGAIIHPLPWDIVGVLPLLRRAGGEIYVHASGEPLSLDRWAQDNFKPMPMIACAPQSFTKLRSIFKITPT